MDLFVDDEDGEVEERVVGGWWVEGDTGFEGEEEGVD